MAISTKLCLNRSNKEGARSGVPARKTKNRADANNIRIRNDFIMKTIAFFLKNRYFQEIILLSELTLILRLI